MAYVPPHLRGRTLASEPTPSDWLKAQQSRCSPQTTNLEPVTFETMCKRAGPPPSVSGSDFWSEGDGGGEKADFDIGFSMFKRGQGPPPMPLRDDNGMARSKFVHAYMNWYNKWGLSLETLWKAEHPQPKPKTTHAKTNTRVEEDVTDYVPRRPGVAEITANSGW